MVGRSVVMTGGTGGLGVAVLRMVLSAAVRASRSPIARARTSQRRRPACPSRSAARSTPCRRTLPPKTTSAGCTPRRSKVEVVLHLAGGFATAPTENVAIEDWNALLALNLTSTFLMCKHALGPIREGGYGRIVTVGSRAAVQPHAGNAAYAASKAGVVALTTAVAEELRGIDATANCVLPSLIATPANLAAMPKAHVERWVTPDSLAHVICFLGSHAAADLRGAAVPVYGGL